MSTRINTNVTAFEAARNLSNNSDMLAKNIQRLSSGLRINSAADDAAGLVISTEFKSQISGLDQATRNSNDAINMVKTAEGALTEVHSLLISMRQLAVHASNAGVNSSTDVAADQLQIQSAIDSINRISSTTQFGNKKLLDGSATAATTTTAATATTTAASLAIGAAGTSTVNATYDTLTVGAGTAATAATSAQTAFSAGGSASKALYEGSVTIDGSAYTVNGGSAGTAATLTQLNTAISASGYTATQDANNNLKFTKNTTGATTTEAVSFTGMQSYANASETGGGSALTVGATTQGAAAVAATAGTLTLHDSTGTAADIVSTAPTVSGGAATYSFSNGLSLTSATGALGAGAVTGAVTTKASTTSTGTALEFQIGANGGQTASQSIQSMAADQLGGNAASYKDASGATQTVGTSSVSKIDVTTFKGAQDAIAVLDKAISDTSTIRAGLGAFQSNVLQSNVRSLGVSEQNLKASESTITDTDLSAEIVDYTKNQILVQASTSALGQANQAPQAILKLLQ